MYREVSHEVSDRVSYWTSYSIHLSELRPLISIFVTAKMVAVVAIGAKVLMNNYLSLRVKNHNYLKKDFVRFEN